MYNGRKKKKKALEISPLVISPKFNQSSESCNNKIVFILCFDESYPLTENHSNQLWLAEFLKTVFSEFIS